jgi:hypothetical protein
LFTEAQGLFVALALKPVEQRNHLQIEATEGLFHVEQAQRTGHYRIDRLIQM